MQLMGEFSENIQRFHIVRGGAELIQNFLQASAYESGYAQALLDIKNWFERHSIALKCCQIYNQKNIEMLLSEISKNADTFQKFGDDTEIYFEYEKKRITKVSIKKEAKK